MTVRNPVVIGEASISGAIISAKRSSIEVLPGYGVACYPLGALNGNIFAVAAGLVGLCANQEQMRCELGDPTYSVAVTLDGDDMSTCGAEAVADQLERLYYLHSPKV